MTFENTIRFIPSFQLHWTGYFNQKAYHFSLLWAELCKTARSCTWSEVLQVLFLLCPCCSVSLSKYWYGEAVLILFTIGITTRRWNCIKKIYACHGGLILWLFVFSQSCLLLLWVTLVQFYALLCKQARALTWSGLKITSKQNNFLFFFFNLNHFIAPGCSSIVDGVKYRWVCGWWRMGRSEWTSSGWVCMQELTCCATKWSFLPWQRRKMPLKASRGRSCPPQLRCLNFKGDSE